MGKKRRTYRCGQRTVRLAGCGMQPKPSSLRAQAQLMRTETCGLLRIERKRESGKEERRRCASRRYHENIIETYLLE
ncbi:hypothetical protein TNCV_1611521 [Trichonephila clavipes]|nr:hypothetical protein TNCV_1611521 [Trichonephila clavipes]